MKEAMFTRGETMVIKLRVLLTLIGLVSIVLAIHFLTRGMSQSGRVRISAAHADTQRIPATSSGLNIALPASSGESKYGLEVGVYAAKSDAQAIAARVDGTVFGAAGAGGKTWWVTIVGPYSSAKEAREHSGIVAVRLNVPAQSMSVTKWPQTMQ
jgi:hypothetical protein